jgi:hypothetical protein
MRKYLSILVVLLALTARFLPGPRVIDDAYITFRYARNLVEGQGLVYNTGERVLGTTTPLFSLIMAGMNIVTGQSIPYPWLALLTSAVADSLTCLLLLRLGKRANYPAAGLAAAFLWAVHPYAVTFAIGGMETSLFVLLLTTAGTAHLEKRRVVVAVCASLALITRPDAALLVVLLLTDRLWGLLRRKENRPSAAELLAFVLPLAVWYGFAWLYYGSPLPHSILAKMAAYRLEPSSAFIRLLQHYAVPFTGSGWIGPVGIAMGLVLYPVFFLLGVRPVIKQFPAVWPLAVYPWLYLVAFSLPNPLIFRWYLTPPLPMYIFFILIGVERALRSLAFLSRVPARLLAANGMFLFLIPLVSVISGWTPLPDHGARRPSPDMAWTKLEDLYRQAAGVIIPKMQPGDVVAAGDVGVLGWETRAPILDLVGLNSSITGKYYPLDAAAYVINYAVPSDLIMDTQPAFVAILEVYGRETLLKDPRFEDQYRLLEKIPTDFYGSDGLLVFQKIR